MDDKELIKRIMEEVKDEKLREELLALVVEKNRRQRRCRERRRRKLRLCGKAGSILESY